MKAQKIHAPSWPPSMVLLWGAASGWSAVQQTTTRTIERSQLSYLARWIEGRLIPGFPLSLLLSKSPNCQYKLKNNLRKGAQETKRPVQLLF